MFFCNNNPLINPGIFPWPQKKIIFGDGAPKTNFLLRSRLYAQDALTPEATVLDNVCYALHNMEHLTERPAELKEEIFKLLFEYAEIRNFTAAEIAQYEQAMTTERDIRNQIAYAKSEGAADERLKIAKAMLKDGLDPSFVAKYSGLTEEEVKAL